MVNQIGSQIRRKLLLCSGYSEVTGGDYRADSTAWAVIASCAGGEFQPNDCQQSRSRLSENQERDGRVLVSKEYKDVVWVTPLAILAWFSSVVHQENLKRAIQYILNTQGRVIENRPNQPVQIDTSLRGWSWNENTFSWVEPTALSIMALNLNGFRDHPRVQEAVRMLLDRQIPEGGWNYGNTIVYDTQLFPQPDCTGLALSALSGLVERTVVEKSIQYSKKEIQHCRTPHSLGWAILGLASWGERPTRAEDWINECMGLQELYGEYGTTLLSLLYLAQRCKSGLIETILYTKN